jgi:hypothetical protein
MTAELRAHLDDYLSLRRGLGFTLACDGQVLAQSWVPLDMPNISRAIVRLLRRRLAR